MSRGKVPPELTVGELVKATGWTAKVVRTRMRARGLLSRSHDRFYRVSRRRLMDRDPDVYDDVFAYFERV